MNGWALALGDDGEVREIDAAEACARRDDPPPFFWVHLDGREQETAAWLEAHGGLPETVKLALTAVETRPRTEPIGAGALVNLRGLGADDRAAGDALVSIRLWAERGRVISVSFRRLARFEALVDMMKAGRIVDPGDLVTAIAVGITAKLDPEVAELGDRIDDCEEHLDPSRAFEMRRVIAAARATAIAYRRFVAPERAALERLATLEVDWLEENDRLHLREAADRFARMTEELEAVRERAALLHEQLIDLRAEQIDTRTLILSMVALVFLPLTFLTGLLGVNVAGIPFAQAPWAFWAVVALCAAIATGITGYFVARHWLRG